MKKKDRKEFYIATLAFMLILAITDIAVIKQSIAHKILNGVLFEDAGMMEYTNPVDGKVLYIPIYQKVIK